MPEKIVNMAEWEASKNKENFEQIATKIRKGTLQIHFVGNPSLFARTDEILYFALEGERLTPGSPDYDEKRKKAVQQIQYAVKRTLEALLDCPEEDCVAVRESLQTIQELADKIRI